MGQPRRILLTEEQQAALRQLRDTAPKAYLRERAAALLKVAAGLPAAVVARERLLRPRDPDTVYRWLDRFEAAGLPGLTIRPGRGRKPAFSPSLPRAGGGAGSPLGSDPPRTAGLRDPQHPLDPGPDPSSL